MSIYKEAARLIHRDEAGQSMVEYSIVTALIAVVAIAAVQTLGEGVVGVFESISGAIGII